VSTIADHYLAERRALATRLRGALARLAAQRTLTLALACAGLLITFAGMLAFGGPGLIGTIWFIPWVALLAAQLGPTVGAASGAAAALLYLSATEVTTDPDDALAFVLRLVPLVGIGIVTGLSSRRMSSTALELQSTSALQQALLDSTVDGICLTDVAGNIVLANAPLQHLALELGLPLHGTAAERLGALADRTTEPARYRERMHGLTQDLAPSEDEFELAESGRVFRGSTAPVVRRDGTAVGRIWTLCEVTADRRLERLRDAFVAAVSHELRTPLTSISGFLELLGDEEHGLGPDGRKYVGAIRRSNDRLCRAVEDLLLVAEIEADRLELHPGPADLADLATSTVEAALPTAASKGIELVLDVTASLPLEADAARLRQVLDNLVSNALKFTPSGGSVTVAARNGDGPVRLEVTDTGIGIPHDELGQVFSRFYRASTATRRAIPGTGVGLVIARAIVEGHGGTITLDSTEGTGTKVTVTLPSESNEAAEPESRPTAGG
jgi:signal transduction histidine kinase